MAWYVSYGKLYMVAHKRKSPLCAQMEYVLLARSYWKTFSKKSISKLSSGNIYFYKKIYTFTTETFTSRS